MGSTLQQQGKAETAEKIVKTAAKVINALVIAMEAGKAAKGIRQR